MKSLTTLLMSLALASSVLAGPVASKNPKAPAPVAPPAPGCGCFTAGGSFDAFGAAIFEGGKSDFGGGLGYNYFFNRNVGFDLNYSVFDTKSQHHEIDGNLIFRAPIDSLCLAPYALIGGGYSTNGTSRGNFDLGGGLDIRIPSVSCIGIFAEGAYHFAAEDSDYTTVRMGMRIPF